MGKRRRHDHVDAKTSEKDGCKKPKVEETWLKGQPLARNGFSRQYRMGALIARGYSGRVTLLHGHDAATESSCPRPLVCKLLSKTRELAAGTADSVEHKTYKSSVHMVRRLILAWAAADSP